MTDYVKKKNDELAALCKERGLAHTGKKADLVKRLEDADAAEAPASASGAAATAKPVVEDEIDWDDEPATETAKAATTAPAANAVAAGGIGEVSNPQAVPNQASAVDPAKTDDLSVAPPTAEAANGAAAAAAPEEEKKKEETDYSSGIAQRTLTEEIEKRKARARKFGMPEDSDEIKALERSLRFGTNDLPGLLNKALPDGREKKRGREADESGNPKRSRGPKGTVKPASDGRSKPAQSTNGGSTGWMSDKDREAMEKRKARFAGSTAS